MNAFIGQFFSVTQYSIFWIQIQDLLTSPRMTKVAIHQPGRELVVPVGGRMIGGLYVGITAKGIFKYRNLRGQVKPTDMWPKRIEEISKACKQRIRPTFPPVALFLDRAKADECFGEESTTPFDPLWRAQTIEVLKAIGPDHPLVTISTEGDWAVPEDLRNPSPSKPGPFDAVVHHPYKAS